MTASGASLSLGDAAKMIAQNQLEEDVKVIGPIFVGLWKYIDDVERMGTFERDYMSARQSLEQHLGPLDRKLAEADVRLRDNLAKAKAAERLKARIDAMCSAKINKP